MTKETMTVHKALSELKIIDERIEKAIYGSKFVVENKNSNAKIDGKSIEDFKASMKANLDKVTSLIDRKFAIKKAVDMSNATTKVKINDEEMTVVEAINMKNHGLATERKLLERLEQQYGLAKTKVAKENVDVTAKAEKYVIDMYGGKDTKTDPSILSKAKAEFIEMNTYDLVDGIGIEKVIETMTNRYDSFMSEVDSALSVSNALTVIEIEY